MTEQKLRRAFEGKIDNHYPFRNFRRDKDGAYLSPDVAERWDDWKAACEYATRAERERCVGNLRALKGSPDICQDCYYAAKDAIEKGESDE